MEMTQVEQQDDRCCDNLDRNSGTLQMKMYQVMPRWSTSVVQRQEEPQVMMEIKMPDGSNIILGSCFFQVLQLVFDENYRKIEVRGRSGGVLQK